MELSDGWVTRCVTVSYARLWFILLLVKDQTLSPLTSREKLKTSQRIGIPAASIAPESLHGGQCEQEEHFVDAAQASRFLHCSRKHLLRLSSLRLVPAHPLPGLGRRRTWRYLLSELRSAMLDLSSNCGPNHHDGRTIKSGGSRKGGR